MGKCEVTMGQVQIDQIVKINTKGIVAATGVGEETAEAKIIRDLP